MEHCTTIETSEATLDIRARGFGYWDSKRFWMEGYLTQTHAYTPIWCCRNVIQLMKKSTRKVRLRAQASSEQADDQRRPRASREMLPIPCHAQTCLSTVTPECTSHAKRFSPKTANEKKFLYTKSLTFILTKNQSGNSTVPEKP